MEIRAQAIALFFAVAQCFGAFGPWFYGKLIGDGSNHGLLTLGYLIGAVRQRWIAAVEIELAPLSHRLDEDEARTLVKLLAEAGATPGEKGDEHASHTIAARLSEEALTEFLDRLDAHDIGAEIYLPVEFEGRVTVGEYRVASSQLLLYVLEEMRGQGSD